MPFSMPAIPKQTIIILAVVLAVIVSLGVANHLSHKPASVTVEKDIPVAAGEVTLQGRGKLPHLHIVAARDPALRDMIARLGNVPVEQIFIDTKDADLMIVGILFRWSGADLAENQLYGPYVDARIVSFLKTIGVVPETVLAGQEIPVEQATALNTQWFAIFDHYRTRLLTQLSGKVVYNNAASYDLGLDQIVVNGAISTDFVRAFQDQLQDTDNSGEAMRAFLDFISATKGFSMLDDAEQDLIMSLNVAQEPVPQSPSQPQMSQQVQSAAQPAAREPSIVP